MSCGVCSSNSFLFFPFIRPFSGLLDIYDLIWLIFPNTFILKLNSPYSRAKYGELDEAVLLTLATQEAGLWLAGTLLDWQEQKPIIFWDFLSHQGG